MLSPQRVGELATLWKMPERAERERERERATGSAGKGACCRLVLCLFCLVANNGQPGRCYNRINFWAALIETLSYPQIGVISGRWVRPPSITFKTNQGRVVGWFVLPMLSRPQAVSVRNYATCKPTLLSVKASQSFNSNSRILVPVFGSLG